MTQSIVLNLLIKFHKITQKNPKSMQSQSAVVYNPLLHSHRSNLTFSVGGKKSSAAYFQLSCVGVPNRNLYFLNLIFNTCAETSLPLPSWCNVFSFTIHCSFSFYIASWWDAFSFGHISFDSIALQLNILF